MKKEHKRLSENRNTQARECSVCREVKVWIFHKRSGMSKLYRVDDGRIWNGSKCPDCAKVVYGSEYQKKRSKRRQIRSLIESDSF